MLARSSSVVPGGGIEPTCPCERGILSPLRIPFRHPGSVLLRPPSLLAMDESVNDQCAASARRVVRPRAIRGDPDRPRSGARPTLVRRTEGGSLGGRLRGWG